MQQSTQNKLDRLKKTLCKEELRIIGAMSGMSMDGIDLALCSISGEFPNLKIQLEQSYFKAYSTELKKKLQEARDGEGEHIAKLNFDVAYAFADCVNEFLKAHSINSESIDAIGSHGQTLYHSISEDSRESCTLQIGSGSVIAEETGILTISNFRERDIVAAGTGAPFIPLLDYVLYQREEGAVALNNLGSISNLSVITSKLGDVFAFDIGPANMPIDFFAEQIGGNTSGCDFDGQYSKKGKVNEKVLKELLENPFYEKTPPKAAGYQEFGAEALSKIQAKYSDVNLVDLVRTAVELSAQTTANAYKKFVYPKTPVIERIVFTGGGAKNPTLIARIKELLPDQKIETLYEADEALNDAKEAICFALLARQTLHGETASVPEVTGAKYPTICGDISL